MEVGVGGELVVVLHRAPVATGEPDVLQGCAQPLFQLRALRVVGVIDWYGPADLRTMGQQARPDALASADNPDSREAQLLGGPGTYMIGNLIQQQFFEGQNQPLGSALTVVLMAALALFMVFYLRSSQGTRRET